MPCLNRILVTALLAFGLGLDAAPAWAPIPATAWAIKAGGSEAPKGAVVLQERLKLNSHDIEWWYRVRIVSEAGKSAAELSGFPEKPLELLGRTVYPDGKSVDFNSKKDFKVNTVTLGSYQKKVTNLIPPGVTADCIVEIYYREAVTWANWFHWERRIMRSHPSQSCLIEFSRGFPLAWTLFGTGFHRPEVTEDGNGKILAFSKLPAGDDGPYLIEAALEQPCLVLYRIDGALQQAAAGGPDSYWKQVAELGYQTWYTTNLKKGSRYKALAKELLANLPTDPQAAARLITERMHARIQNLDHLSWEEADQRKRTKADGASRIDSEDLGETARYGATDNQGMTLLLFQLLTDANLNPKLMMVADRDRRIFRYRSMNRHQFTHVLLGVEELGKPMLWIDAPLKLLPCGMLNPDYQGTFGLLVDTKTWTVKQQGMPAQPADNNTQNYDYRLSLQGEQLGFTLKAAFTGQPAFIRRMDCLADEPKERDRDLKEGFEKRLANWTVTEAKVLEATEVTKPLGWSLAGHREWEEGRRTELRPFPGMPNPYVLPDVWPEPRKARIVLPYLKVHKATCTLALPKGYRLQPASPLDETNLFGHVRWRMTTQPAAEGLQAVIELEVVGKTLSASPEDYRLFRDYMGWISEAMNRVLVIEKVD